MTNVNILELSQMALMDNLSDVMEAVLDEGMNITNLNSLSIEASKLCDQISSLYPSFNNFSDETKSIVLAEVWNHSILQAKFDEHGGNPICFGVLEDERDRAIRRAKWGFGLTTAAWVASAAGGPLGAALATGGMIVASMNYCDTWYASWELYHLKGGTEPRPRSQLCD